MVRLCVEDAVAVGTDGRDDKKLALVPDDKETLHAEGCIDSLRCIGSHGTGINYIGSPRRPPSPVIQRLASDAESNAGTGKQAEKIAAAQSAVRVREVHR